LERYDTGLNQAKAEVLRYLGRRGQEVPPELDKQVEECMELVRGEATPRHVKRGFDIARAKEGVTLSGAGILLRGKDIREHLSGCGKAVLMAATLGAGLDTLIRRWERADITRALILDACATQLIEECCDETEWQIREEVAADGCMATGRYSPGYGDFDLEIQPELIAVLDAQRRIGLTCTGSLILLPRKSITAVIGLGRGLIRRQDACERCDLRGRCEYRKDGNRDECTGLDKR